MASGERFSGFSGSGLSTGLPRKPQQTCHSARRSVWRRARLVWELAEEVRPDANGLCEVVRGRNNTVESTVSSWSRAFLLVANPSKVEWLDFTFLVMSDGSLASSFE